MPPLHVLRVFVGNGGIGGNPLGVFLDGGGVPEGDRQMVAADLGFSETVFVEDPGQDRLRIFTPKEELPFAGHPLVGTAWLLTSKGFDVSALHPPAGEVPVRVEGVVAFISARPEWAPQFEHIELSSSTLVEELAGPPDDHNLAGAWAWEDEEAGYVRARVFPVRLGIEEGETTGAHAVRLAARLGPTIVIRQGEGFLIFAGPRPDGTVEIGGRTELVEVREHYASTNEGGIP